MIQLGDPTIIGWTITYAYLLASLLCFLTAHFHKKNISQYRSNEYILWIILGIALLILGFNKRLDLQQKILFLGKQAAFQLGLDSRRQLLQQLFVGLASTVSLFLFGIFVYIFRSKIRQFWMIAAGILLIIIFAILRNSEFNHVDHFSKMYQVLAT
jgi:hypothetical protein